MPLCPYAPMLYAYPFLMLHLSHDHMAKRSHHRIMILYMTFGVLLYGRTPTLIFFFHFFHNPTTPILPVYVDQRRSNLQEDTVIVMTFLVCLNGTDLDFFELFILFSLGIDHDPLCSLCSHDLCLFPFSYFISFTRLYGQEKSFIEL